MCHLCRKVENLRAELDGLGLRPISALISRLHTNLEPRLEDFWFQRHEKTVKLRALLSKAHDTAPIKPLRSVLDIVDRELEHIRKNMPDHPREHGTGRLHVLKEVIFPNSSASLAVRRSPADTRKDSQGERVRPHDITEERGVSNAIIQFNAAPELPGSNIGPTQAGKDRPVKVVEEGLRGGDAKPRKKHKRRRRKEGEPSEN